MALEWLTYAAAGERLGISPEAVRQRAIRHEWTRRTGNDGKAEVRVDVDELRAAAPPKAVSSSDGRPSETSPTGDQTPVDHVADGRTIEALDAHIATLKTMVARAEHEAERERERTADQRRRADVERTRADDLAAELVKARAESAEQVADVERHVADLRKVVEAMKAPAAEARAREAALEARIESVRAEAATLQSRTWWKRLVG